MEVPKEFRGKFKFAMQKSKLAGTIRGSFFVIKGDINDKAAPLHQIRGAVNFMQTSFTYGTVHFN